MKTNKQSFLLGDMVYTGILRGGLNGRRESREKHRSCKTLADQTVHVTRALYQGSPPFPRKPRGYNDGLMGVLPEITENRLRSFAKIETATGIKSAQTRKHAGRHHQSGGKDEKQNESLDSYS